MLMVKLTRTNVLDGTYSRAHVAGPFDDKVDADYVCKQLRGNDANPDSKYEVVKAEYVVTVTRPKTHVDDETKVEVVSWHETKEDCEATAAAMQRGDYTVTVEPKKWPLK